MPALFAFLVFVVVALAVFVAISLVDQRSDRARTIKDRLAAVQKTPDQPVEEEVAEEGGEGEEPTEA